MGERNACSYGYMPPQKTWEEYKCEIEAIKKSNNCNSEKEEIAFAQSVSFSVIIFLWRNVNYQKNGSVGR